MVQTPYTAVVRLAEQLSPEDQQALIEHLQEIAKQRELSFKEWQTALNSLKIETPLVGTLSDRRADWYDDDGR